MLFHGLRFMSRKKQGTEREYRIMDRKEVRGLWIQLSRVPIVGTALGSFANPERKKGLDVNKVAMTRSNLPPVLEE